MDLRSATKEFQRQMVQECVARHGSGPGRGSGLWRSVSRATLTGYYRKIDTEISELRLRVFGACAGRRASGA